MIQFKRGKTINWLTNETKLAAGQPGYDKDTHKIKIGDGEHSWSELPYASGLSNNEILSSEAEAKIRRKAALLINPLAGFLDSPAVITYGSESPDKNTVGQLYLQCYDTAPEVDYIIKSGIDGIWRYHQWKSGKYECCGTLEISTSLQEALGSLYSDKKVMKRINYPVTFKNIPTELASIQSPGGIVWLASRGENTKSKSALYSIISPSEQSNTIKYKINLYVSGY